jgi:hypothetical protein
MPFALGSGFFGRLRELPVVETGAEFLCNVLIFAGAIVVAETL